jgi:hypothetical protein
VFDNRSSKRYAIGLFAHDTGCMHANSAPGQHGFAAIVLRLLAMRQ